MKFVIVLSIFVLFFMPFIKADTSMTKESLPEQELVSNAYKEMYRAMSQKGENALSAILDDSFVLVHMTGMRQPKTAFIKAVLDGTLNYYAYKHENISVEMDGNEAYLIGQTRVEAAVFGGGKHTWRLQQNCKLRKINGFWKITSSEASVY